MEKIVLEKIDRKIAVALFDAACAASNKDTTVLYQFRPPLTVFSPTENSKIQGLFKA